MALKKTVITTQGLEANYWKVDMITIDKNSLTASCVLHLYKDKDLSTQKDTFAESRYVTLATGIDYTEYEQGNEAEEIVVPNKSIDSLIEERFYKYFSEEAQYANLYQACYQMTKDLDKFFADAENC